MAYRPLTTREKSLLDFLLSADTPGVAELRAQAKVAQAQSWDCGCGSFDLTVRHEDAPRSEIGQRGPAIEAVPKSMDNPGDVIGLLLWVTGGWLSGVEVVDVKDNHADCSGTVPAPDEFGPPVVRAYS